MEKNSLCRVLGDLPKILWKLCFSTNFLHQEVGLNFGIIHSASRLLLIKCLTFTGEALIKEKFERHVEERKLCEVQPTLIIQLTKLSEVALPRCCYKKMFAKYAANLQEKTHAEV